MIKRFLSRGIFLWLCLALPVLAYEGNDGASPDGGDFNAGLSSKTTGRVTRTLTRDFRRCQMIAPIYQTDCYRQVYARAIRHIAGNTAYRPAQKALESVEDRLEQVIQTYADPGTPPLKSAARTYVAIKPAAVPRANAALSEALDEAATVLLRSDADNPHFTEIAAALATQKQLLRAMGPGRSARALAA